MNAGKESSTILRPILIGAGVGVLGAIAAYSGALSSWSARASDTFFEPFDPDPSIVIVAIDDTSIQRIGRWPWDRSVHARLIRKLSSAGASVIGYDINFPESQDAANDNELASALIDVGHVVLPIELTLEMSREGLTYQPDTILQPISLFAGNAAKTGHVNTRPDSDGIVRRVIHSVQASDASGELQSFAYQIARQVDRQPDLDSIPTDSHGFMLLNFAGRPKQTYPTLSAADILQDDIPDLSIFKDKIVLVGSTAPDLHDEKIVSTSNGTPMPGIEIHASALNTMLQHRWLVPVNPLIAAILLFALGLLMGLLIPTIRARWTGVVAIGLFVAILMLAFYAFDQGRVVDVVWPTIVLILSYSAVTLERRMTAETQKRELKMLFTRYVSPSVVQSILMDPSKVNLGGERRNMTVFFSDIRGFTTISEQLDPEELVEKLNIYLMRMTQIVFETDGVLDKYIGDAVMAFWNAPFDQHDHAKQGVRTALAMKRALKEMNASHAFDDLKFQIGMGLNSGEMVVGNVGGKEHASYTVIGDNVNLGSRLESLTKQYKVWIIITAATHDGLDGEFITRKLDKVAVKGKKEPVTIYEVVTDAASANDAHKQLAADYESALAAYFKKNFSDAIERCDSILAGHPGDGPATLLRERAEEFKKTPPPSDWDGTWVYTKK